MSSRRFRAFGVVAVVVMGASFVLHTFSARAEPFIAIGDQSIDVSAERVDIDAETGTATLVGGVTARLGDVEVHADRVEVKYDRAPRVSWARGTGSVSARLKGIDATAAVVEFDAKSNTVALSGSVRLSRGKGWMTADRATMNLSTTKVSLDAVKGSVPVQPGALAPP